MFLRRAIVVFTLGPLTLLLIHLGGWFYFLSFAALLGIATYEFGQLASRLAWRTPMWLLLPFSFLLWLSPRNVQLMLFGRTAGEIDFVSIVLLLSLMAAMAYSLWLFERKRSENAPASWMATVGGILFLGWLGSYFFRLRAVDEMASQWTALTMLGTWIADSGAYVFGKTLGKHKMAPRLSPNKTMEGYFGGIFAATLFTVVIAYFLDLPLLVALVLGLLVSALSPAGDLGVSLLKRSVGVKDSGNFLPGHGGALDRIDSLIWSVALAYFLVVLVT
ncbi:MAG: phosphatidate cytidylyltransferase [Chloroflexota bacterium]|jgi:phosphatidate cytidylyltransferase